MNKRNKEQGFAFVFQSIIAIIILALFLIPLQQESPNSLKELQIIQQENDLFRVWSAKETTENEMIQDTKLLFGEKAEPTIDSRKVLTTGLSENVKLNCISSDAQIVTKPFLTEKNITITVCER